MADHPRPTRLQAFVHLLDPYSLRVLYAIAFKYIDVELIEVDLNNKSDEFLEVSHAGKTPAIRYWLENESHTLVESRDILNFLEDNYPGPPLYPQTLSLSPDKDARALLTEHSKVIDIVAELYFKFIAAEPTDTEYAQLRDALKLLNEKYLVNGRPFSHSLVSGEDQITAADLLLLPFIERLDATRALIFGREVLAQKLDNVWAWLARMNTQGWYAQFKQQPRYFQKAVERRRVVGGNLTLPITLYH